MRTVGKGERRLFSIVDQHKLRRILQVMLDETEFLSPHGIRALSRYHREHPFTLDLNGVEHRVDNEPGESSTGLFGGNANWRGPVWFPVNYLLIESLQKFHHYLGEEFKVECPTGSGRYWTLWEVSQELSRRLNRTFLRDQQGYLPRIHRRFLRFDGASRPRCRRGHERELDLQFVLHFYQPAHTDRMDAECGLLEAAAPHVSVTCLTDGCGHRLGIAVQR